MKEAITQWQAQVTWPNWRSTGTDVVAAWNALEPVVAQCAGLLGTPATKSDYYVGHSDDQATVAGADLRDCLDRVESPTSISVTYTASSELGL